MTENAQAEGDDVPDEPVCVVLYGDNVATVDGALSMLASGASALRRREVGLRRRDALSEPLG